MPDSDQTPISSRSAVWPAGGGAMGALVRAHDWSLTPLGPAESWPASLRGVVDLVLDSPLGMVVLWGADLIQIYNDGYAAVAGAKHPQALGQPTRECWPEVWHFSAPVYEAVRRGETRSFRTQKLRVERHGLPEDAWFDLTYGPVRDDAGAIAGVLVTVVEISAEVRARATEQRARATEQRAEERLRTVLESTTDCVIVLDRDWTIVHQNRRAVEIVNAGRHLLGTSIWDVFPEARGSRFWDEYHRAMRDQVPVEFTAFLTALGRWFEVHGYPSADQLTLFFRDVTQARRQTAELRDTQERLQLALRSGGVATWTWDIAHDVILADAVCAGFFGLDPRGLEAGWPLAAFLPAMHPEDRPRVETVIARAVETGEDFEAEYRVTGRGGVERWVLARGRCEHDQAGRPTRFPGFLVDVTHRRAAEAALAASEARLRAVLDQMPVGVSLAAVPSGELVYHNSKAIELIRHPLRASADHSGYAQYGALHAGGQPYAPEEYPIARAVLGGETIDRQEMLYRRGDGTLTHFAVSGAPIRDADGRVVMAVSTFEDISGRKAIEERQRLLMREVDHRARNVLAVVQAVVRLTRAGTTREFIDAVHGRVQALARAHALVAQARWTGADVRTLVCEELAPYLTADEKRLQLSGPDITVTADTAQPLGMVLHELATNAAKYGALSRPRGRVDVAWGQTAEGGLRLDWHETGGPPARTPDRRGFGSELIEVSASGQLRGSVDFDWNPEGLRCTLIVGPQCLIPTEAADGAAVDRRDLKATAVRLKGRRVLVVEDDGLLAMSLRGQLAALGCSTVGPAGTLESALRLAATETLDAAVLDLNLAGSSALPVADVLRARGVPHMFATGYGGDGLAGRGVPVLEKPFAPERLEAALRTVIAGAEA